jgi:hypothetical protein
MIHPSLPPIDENVQRFRRRLAIEVTTMVNQIVSDILVLLIPTLWIAFLLLTIKLVEISYEGHSDRLPSWIRRYSRKLPPAMRPLSRMWRWLLAALLVPVYIIYIGTFDATPLLIRFLIAMLGLAVFGACIYYIDKKMGK